MDSVLLLHGGAGSDSALSPTLKKYADSAIRERDVLISVVKAVSLMEDDITFNAGTGSCQRLDGTIQMDASVMTAYGMGSVIAIENVKNPVKVALSVMKESPHLIMCGDGAVKFARIMGFPEFDPDTEKAKKQHDRIVHDIMNNNPGGDERIEQFLKIRELSRFLKYGEDTVGAVGRFNGEFAAAVSTGGAAPMLRGRVGDSPLPGCGIYVGKKGAVVATGIGEEIIKRMLCFSVYERIGKAPLHDILREEVENFGDYSVGIIAVDSKTEASYSNRNMATAVSKLPE